MEVDKPQIAEHASLGLNYTVFQTRWVPQSARLVALGSHPRGTGALEIYSLSKGELKKQSEVEKPSGFKCGTFGASSMQTRHLATGDFSGKLHIWDLERLDAPVFTATASAGSIINAIDGCGGLNVGVGAAEIVTGSRDGSVRVWDPRVPDPVADMSPADVTTARDCWTVAFGNAFNAEERCVCAGYDNGDVKLFDLRTMSARWEGNLGAGVCSVQFDRKDIAMNKLLCVGLESRVRVYDLRTQHPASGFASVTEKHHNSTIWAGVHLPQNRDVFLTSGGNGGLALWKYDYPAQRHTKGEDGVPVGVAGTLSLVANVNVAGQPINSADWHSDKLGLLAVTGFDQSLRVCVVTNLATL
eukprot:m.44355 g.44355  ORF g.44355 m.44355 type:complete len:357 (-) comp10902_c0_seq1:169-1239(-)